MIPKSVKTRFRSRIRGVFSKAIPFSIREENGDWSKWFGHYEGQKKDWFDTSCCWAYAENEKFEDGLEFSGATGGFSKETMDWFKAKGFIDADGDFYLSRRFIPIISGRKNGGNDPSEFWRLTKIYGAIPNSMLPFTTIDEYFDESKVTPEMYALGKEFLSKIDIDSGDVGRRFTPKDKTLIQTYLKECELSFCIPVPQDGSWNQVKVDYPVGRKSAEHDVACYKYDEVADYAYPYFIYDQYEPHLKQLSRDYYIPIVTRTVITPRPQVIPAPVVVDQMSIWSQVWRAVQEWFVQNPTWLRPKRAI